ncbi:MAG: hypothetical protein DMD78_20965 [Candidatus Rokuibacteriota bacterium]|nr:MAG: hypothetical protein DMD78_20965 [Candidatus Rokubacteria bacterium]
MLEAGLPIDLVSLDATRQALLPRGDLEATLARRPGPFATRCAAFTLRGFSMDAARGTPGMVLHDPLAVAVALDPTLVTWDEARIAVAADGTSRRAPGAPNCRVAGVVDVKRVVGNLLERLCPAS